MQLLSSFRLFIYSLKAKLGVKLIVINIVMLIIYFRSVERENKKTSYPKWLNKLPDAAKSGVDTANLASDDDNQISSETGVIPGYKVSLSNGPSNLFSMVNDLIHKKTSHD